MSIRVMKESGEVNFPAFTSTSPMVAKFFSSVPDSQRETALERVLTIGVAAMQEDRIAAFLARTESELGAHLEALKQLYDRNTLRNLSAPIKGAEGEIAVANALTTFIEARKYADEVGLIGNTSGALSRNKTGDIICTVGDGERTASIVIECKLDKSVRLGDPSVDGQPNGRSDTAWSQMIEARANRTADLAIMVFSMDSVDRSITGFTDSVRFIDGVGYIVVVDIIRSDFRPLAIAYELARQHVLQAQRTKVDAQVLDVLVRRFCADLNAAVSIKTFVSAAIENCNQALVQIDTTIAGAESTHRALKAYLSTGVLDNQQLLGLLVPHKALTP